MNAIFSVAYTGQAGMGLALLVFFRGVVAGADISGATYDGTYDLTDDGGLVGRVRLKVPPGVPLVTGTMPTTESYAVDFDISLPSDAGDEKPVLLNLPIGKVNAIFRKIRDLDVNGEEAGTSGSPASCAP